MRRSWRAALAAVLLGVLAPSSLADEAATQNITARDLAQLRDVEALSFSPDGRFAAFVQRTPDVVANNFDHSWIVVSLPAGESRRIADGGEPHFPPALDRAGGMAPIPPAAWAADGSWIAYVRSVDGRRQIWRTFLHNGHTEALTENQYDVTQVVSSAASGLLLFSVSPTKAEIERALAEEYQGGYLYDARFYPGYDVKPVRLHDWWKDQDAGATSSSDAVWVFDINTRRERLATQEEAAEFKAKTAVSGDADQSKSSVQVRAVSIDREGSRQIIVIHPDGERVACTLPTCAGAILRVWWIGESEVAFVREEDAVFQALYVWDITNGLAPRLVIRTDATLYRRASQGDCAVLARELICFVEEKIYPRRLAKINLDSGAVDFLYDPNDGFSRFDLGRPPELVNIPTGTGRSTHGYLVLPPSGTRSERLPLIVVTYRCYGFLRGGTGNEYPVFAFAAEGFAVLCYDAPTGDPEEQARFSSYEAYIDWLRGPGDRLRNRTLFGLRAVIRMLADAGVIDDKRIGLTGLSFGSETVMHSLFNLDGLAAAISSGGEIGPFSPALYGLRRTQLQGWGLGDPDSRRWNDLSVVRNADRVKAALLINVADRELMSAIGPYTALEDAQRAVEMHVYPGEHHVKWQPAHRSTIFERNVDWMNFWLRGVEDADIEKRHQYARWRKLREVSRAN